MTLNGLFPRISCYKVLEEEIRGDSDSNVITITRIYKVPRLFPHAALHRFYEYNDAEFFEDGLKIYSYASGWADPMCRKFMFKIIIIPNGGKLIYSGEEIGGIRGIKRMKILKHGTKYNQKHGTNYNQSMMFFCSRCGCEFEAENGEWGVANLFEPGNMRFESVCPECGFATQSVKFTSNGA